MENKHSLEELRQHIAEVTERIRKVAAEYEGVEFPPDVNEEFEALKAEREKSEKLADDLEKRDEFIRSLTEKPENTESEAKFSFQTRKSNLPDNLTDVDEYRVRATGIDQYERLVHDGAMKLLDTKVRSSHPHVSKEEFQDDMDKLVNLDHEVALRTVFTSNPEYKRDWKNYIQSEGRIVGPYMMRTASLTTTAGGFAVPVELDTTMLLTNAGAINPVRNIARVRQTNVNTVEFINTAGITAGYTAEAVEASDNAPTLAQPTVNIEKAFAFVPMSIEIASDWAGIQEDMALAFEDAKNRLESTKFLKGLGHTSKEPQGLIASGGATAVTSTATTAVFAVADLYSLENALSPRYRARASIVGNRAAYQKIRQFDTAGGASLWVQLQNANPPQLLGYNAYEWSDYDNVSTSGNTILTIGDFNYFAIVDRAGMNVEFIQHLFGGSNRYPTGQRGLYAWWRNSTQVLSPTLSANSAFQSLKLL